MPISIYGPTLENILYVYACSKDCSVSVGRIGKLECDFIIRNKKMDPLKFTVNGSKASIVLNMTEVKF